MPHIEGIETSKEELHRCHIMDLGIKGVKDFLDILLCAGTFALMELTKVSPILIVVSAALIGIAVKTLTAKKPAGRKETYDMILGSSSLRFSKSGSLRWAAAWRLSRF